MKDSLIKIVSFVAGLVLLIFIVLVTLRIVLRQSNLSVISDLYLESYPIYTDYDFYREYGLTDEMCDQFFMHPKTTSLYVRTLADYLSVLFHHTESVYTLEDCEQELRSVLREVSQNASLDLSDHSVSVICRYTMDTNGLTFFLTGSNGVSNHSDLSHRHFLLQGVAFLVSYKCLFLLFAMYSICILVLAILHQERRLFYIANTIFIPSFICFVFSMGEICFFEDILPLPAYLYARMLSVSLISVMISFMIYIIDIWVSVRLQQNRIVTKEEMEKEINQEKEMIRNI